jgi:probable HAF family extracellular repeat protein
MLEGEVWIIKGLGDLPKGAYWSQAYGASKDGSVVVGQGSIANGTRAFRWTSKGMADLGTVAKRKYSAAWGCSEDGSVVVGESFSARGKDEIAFRWTAATGMVGLGDLPGGQVLSEAEATNADGSIVVGWSTTDLGMEAFIWDNANKMRRLTDVLSAQGVTDHNGWVLSSATGVTAVGDTLVIVGKGKNPDGNTEAWRAVIANY